MAADSGLFFAHYEHRYLPGLPPDWLPEGRPELGARPEWQQGVLPEAKYQSFQHDLLAASFHPGHRAKWTAHELVHGLVGFAWHPGAPLLFHALAARLAEALPVALWYFFDEAHLRRCPLHAEQGPLFNDFCVACEEIAQEAPRQEHPEAERWIAQGRAFLDRELASIAKTRRSGLMHYHRHATLDLAKDGLAYASAQAARLNSEAFERFVHSFFPTPGLGWHADLDSLEARVLEIAAGIVDGAPVAPLTGGRTRIVAQDVAWRLLVVRSQTEGEAGDELDRLVDALAANPTGEGLDQVIQGYEAVHADWYVPDPEDVFAVGYDLAGGYGRSSKQVGEGIASAMPATWTLLGGGAMETTREFLREDGARRMPLGRRFAAWLGGRGPRSLAQLAAYEAALAHPRLLDPAATALGRAHPRDDVVRFAPGLELLEVEFDVVELAQSLESGAPTVPDESPLSLIIGPRPWGEQFVAEISAKAAAALRSVIARPCSVGELDLDAREIEQLLDLGILVPVAWASV